MRRLVLELIALPIVVLVTVAICRSQSRVEVVELEEAPDVVKTVAHITVDSSKWEELYVDSMNDVAYYRYIGDKDSPHKVGDKVIFDGEELTITEVDGAGFNLSYTESISPGMSGMPVTSESGEIVGYISSISIGSDIRCIWS